MSPPIYPSARLHPYRARLRISFLCCSESRIPRVAELLSSEAEQLCWNDRIKFVGIFAVLRLSTIEYWHKSGGFESKWNRSTFEVLSGVQQGLLRYPHSRQLLIPSDPLAGFDVTPFFAIVED
jgi:hypothetical protein